ncbi:hypothetical protein JL722_4460 [Aureococcus anophagefferens]|nr:hypothetical protein JL722_4460 [Aureococcus anophagefferens]
MAQTVADLDFDPIALLEQELGSNDRASRASRRPWSAPRPPPLSPVFASVDVSSGGAEVGASAVKIVSGMADPGADATGFGAKVSAAAAAAGDGDDAEPAEEPWYAYEPGVHVVATAHVDASWRVRESLAKSFAGYAARCDGPCPCGHQIFNPTSMSVPDDGVGGCSKLDLGLGLLSMFAALFDDAEVEVRVAAHKSTNDVAATWSACFARHGDCVEAAGRGADAPELKAKLFADEHVDVLLATLRELAVAVPLLEGDSAARVAALVESTAHDNWRVRAALNGALPAVALARGKDAFEAQLLEGFVRSFQDRISEVRTSAVAVLGELRALRKPDGATGLPTDEALFDGDWLMEKIGKRLSELYLTMSYYLYRITIALETVSLHANDRLVANFIKPVLNELLANDTDADVRNYVKGAIAAL